MARCLDIMAPPLGTVLPTDEHLKRMGDIFRRPVAEMLGVDQARVQVLLAAHPSEGALALTFDVTVDGAPLAPDQEGSLLEKLRALGVEARPLPR